MDRADKIYTINIDLALIADYMHRTGLVQKLPEQGFHAPGPILGNPNAWIPAAVGVGHTRLSARQRRKGEEHAKQRPVHPSVVSRNAEWVL